MDWICFELSRLLRLCALLSDDSLVLLERRSHVIYDGGFLRVEQ